MNTTTTNTAGTLALYSPSEGDTYGRMADPLKAVERLGEIIASSGMFGCTKIEQGQVLALQCMTEKKAPLEMAKVYHIIEGKLSMRSDAMLAKFQMAGGTVQWKKRDDKAVEAVFTLRGSSLPFSATLEQFVANGVATGRDGKLKDNWRKFPRQMLTARVISEAVRLLAPEVVFGVYTPEELQDTGSQAPAEARNVTPEPQPKPAVDVVKLESLLGDKEDDVNAFLIARQYVKEGQTFRDIQPDLAQRIISAPKVFLEAVAARASS